MTALAIMLVVLNVLMFALNWATGSMFLAAFNAIAAAALSVSLVAGD